MDICFEILIPVESTVSAVKFKTPVYEWDGVEYPQGPEEAWIHYLKIIKSDIPAHVLSFLPDNLKKVKWQCISIVEGMDELVEEVSIEGEMIEKESNLLDLLDLIVTNEKKWVVIFEPDCDRIDEVIEGDINFAFRRIVKSLKVEVEGFVMWFNRDGK